MTGSMPPMNPKWSIWPAILLPPEAMEWLAGALAEAPREDEAVIAAYETPRGVPPELIDALDAKLATASGLAEAAEAVVVEFETALTALFAATFVSGLIGLYWTRTLPRKLAKVSEEVIYERIPMLRSQLRDRAQHSILDTVHAAGATTLGAFYSDRLHSFFEQPRGLRYYLFPNNRLRKQLLAELTEINRYLSEPERKTCEQLFALVRRRDDLDYHAALQWRLKAWLFLHIGLTYPLLAVASLHGVLAHLFDGGSL